MAEARAEPHPFRSATRILSSVLSPLERRTLQFLAERMPAWVNSDYLTSLGLTAMLGAGLSFWLAGTWPPAVVLVVVCLALNWFGDSLDGTLARYRKQERPRYGYYVDHVVDAFGALFMLGGLALSGYMSPLVAMGLLVGYLMMSIEVYLAAHTLGQFKITYMMMGPTELRILLSIGALWLLVQTEVTILGRPYHLFDVGGMAGIAGLMTILVLTTIKHTRMLYVQEPVKGARVRESEGAKVL